MESHGSKDGRYIQTSDEQIYEYMKQVMSEKSLETPGWQKDVEDRKLRSTLCNLGIFKKDRKGMSN